MESESPEDDFEERYVTMLSPTAQAAMERRHGANTPDNSQDFPGHGGDQLQGNLSQEGGGQVPGDANGPSGVDAPSASTAPINNKRLRTALENLMTVHSMPLQEAFVQHLDQIVLAGAAGKELLTDMIAKASQGENPAPQGDFNRSGCD